MAQVRHYGGGIMCNDSDAIGAVCDGPGHA